MAQFQELIPSTVIFVDDKVYETRPLIGPFKICGSHFLNKMLNLEGGI